MLNAMSGIARAVDSKIGWNRIGVALSLLIIAIAFVMLFRLLQGVELEKVMTALKRDVAPLGPDRGRISSRRVISP